MQGLQHEMKSRTKIVLVETYENEERIEKILISFRF